MAAGLEGNNQGPQSHLPSGGSPRASLAPPPAPPSSSSYSSTSLPLLSLPPSASYSLPAPSVPTSLCGNGFSLSFSFASCSLYLLFSLQPSFPLLSLSFSLPTSSALLRHYLQFLLPFLHFSFTSFTSPSLHFPSTLLLHRSWRLRSSCVESILFSSLKRKEESFRFLRL